MEIDTRKLQQLLANIGLSEKEAAVYITLLQLGETSVLKIAQKSDVKRATVYTILSALIEKGFVAETYRGFKKKYVAESPRKLEQLLVDRTQEFQSHLPDLLALHTYPSSEQSVKVYEGLEGIKNGLNLALEDLEPGDEYFVIANIESLLERMPKFFMNFAKRRATYNITLQTILQDGPLTQQYAKDMQHTREEIKFLPANTQLSANIVITSHRVVMPHLTPFIGAVVIENQQAVATHQTLFKLLWEGRVI